MSADQGMTCERSHRHLGVTQQWVLDGVGCEGEGRMRSEISGVPRGRLQEILIAGVASQVIRVLSTGLWNFRIESSSLSKPCSLMACLSLARGRWTA